MDGWEAFFGVALGKINRIEGPTWAEVPSLDMSAVEGKLVKRHASSLQDG